MGLGNIVLCLQNMHKALGFIPSTRKPGRKGEEDKRREGNKRKTGTVTHFDTHENMYIMNIIIYVNAYHKCL